MGLFKNLDSVISESLSNIDINLVSGLSIICSKYNKASLTQQTYKTVGDGLDFWVTSNGEMGTKIFNGKTIEKILIKDVTGNIESKNFSLNIGAYNSLDGSVEPILSNVNVAEGVETEVNVDIHHSDDMVVIFNAAPEIGVNDIEKPLELIVWFR